MNFLDNSFILLFFHPNITFLKNLKLYLQNLAHSANRKIHLRSLKECTSYGIQKNGFPKISMFDDKNLSTSYITWQKGFYKCS